MNKKSFIAFLVTVVLLFGFYAVCFAEKVVWQQSEAASVQLGIRDKYGSLKSYKAVFVVKSENGTEYKVEKNVKDDAWGYAHFPDDFKVSTAPGDYSWNCLVNGKIVVNGNFKLSTVKTDCDQVTVMRE